MRRVTALARSIPQERAAVVSIALQNVVRACLATLLGWTIVGISIRAEAQSIPREVAARSIPAAVIVMMETSAGRSEGSGSIIHHHGYVLTNFHVVGHVHPFDGGVPGDLYREDGIVTLFQAQTSHDEARPVWTGRVVRGDPQADLALIRIDASVDGSPIPSSHHFPTVPLATEQAELSEPVFALGYPLGIRTVSVTGGQVTGFDIDADGTVTFIRVDADFNPGNSGGMLLNQAGELIGIPTLVVRGREQMAPIEKARPAGRIPADWIRDMQSGISEPTRQNTPFLDEQRMAVRSAGAGLVVQGEELFFLRISVGWTGFVRFSIDEAMPAIAMDAMLMSLDRPRAWIRRVHDNALAVLPTDGNRLLVVVAVRRRRDDGSQGGPTRLLLEAQRADMVGGLGVRQVASTISAPSGAQALVARSTETASEEKSDPLGWASIRIQGALVMDPLHTQDLVGGAAFLAAFTAPMFVVGEMRPLMFTMDYGARGVLGGWRDSLFAMSFVTLGFRAGLGSSEFSVEVPIYYTLGVGSVEDEFSFSPYGYEIGLNARIRNFSIGVTWSESHRGNYSVLRLLGLSTWWYF
jgi:S1-C subfamily serine protease